jgi:hypothetical protein
MNHDIYNLLLKTQKEMYEQQLKNLEDTFIQNIAEKCVEESTGGRCEDGLFSRHNKFLNYILNIINKKYDYVFGLGLTTQKYDKRIILKMLEIKGSALPYRQNYRINTYDRYCINIENKDIPENVAFRAIVMNDGNIRDMDKSMINIIETLYKYIGEDFATREEIDRFLKHIQQLY